MTNGEKFKEIFGFGTDGSRVIAVNSTWWDCEFQNSKPITKRVPTADMRADELVETIRKQCYHMDCGNCNTCVKLKAADAIEKLSCRETPMKITEIHVDEYYCPACGAENNCDQGYVQDAYCPACGQRLLSEPPKEEK